KSNGRDAALRCPVGAARRPYLTACSDDHARAGEGRLRHNELNDRAASDETSARTFAEYLARNRPFSGTSWLNCSNRGKRDLPSASRHGERFRLYQPGG